MDVATGTIVLHDAEADQWLYFKQPLRVHTARSVSEVVPVLQQAQDEADAHFVAGFVAYEAAPAFDPALRTRAETRLPLAWFAIFEPPEIGPAPLPSATNLDLGAWSFPSSTADYTSAIQRIRDLIRSGETYQVNYTMRLRAPYAGEPWDLFAHLAGRQRAPYAAFIQTEDWAICSASPELFFRLEGGELVCRPMKGTASRGLWTEEDEQQKAKALFSPKNKAENIMIVDMVRNDLGRIAQIGSVKVTELFQAEKYPTLWQMTSTVRCQTSASVVEIFRALFPAASITGAPKVQTTRIIAQLEQSPRRIYTGAIGFMAPGRWAQFNVAIRTVLIDRHTGQAEYGVGGGIVWDSSPEQELEECRVKAGILTSEAPEFDLLETILWTPAEGYSMLDAHLRRLAESADYFLIPAPLSKIRPALAELAKHLPRASHRVRLLVRQTGEFVLDPLPLSPFPAPYRLALAVEPVNSRNVFLYHKTSHREVFASARASMGNADDALLWNERGELTQSTIANVIVEKDGALLTPPIRCGLLPGLYRSRLLEQGMAREAIIPVSDLPGCSKIYLANSVRGLWETALELPTSPLSAPAAGAKYGMVNGP